MTIWKVMCNNDYRNFCLVNSNNEYVTDILSHFEEKQEEPYFSRTIRTLKDDNNPLGDIMNYSSMSGTFLVNERTKKVLEKHFNEIQFFNTICPEYPEEKFFILNVLNYKDVLDINKSKYKTGISRYGELKIGTIKSYAFKEEVRNLDIFKIIVNGVKRADYLFVTDKFKKIIEENNITGLSLRKVYEI